MRNNLKKGKHQNSNSNYNKARKRMAMLTPQTNMPATTLSRLNNIIKMLALQLAARQEARIHSNPIHLPEPSHSMNFRRSKQGS
tara:strand:+ start:200 stop:451 length:252 start_codon:yes stop_codon:yes gene_type:complete